MTDSTPNASMQTVDASGDIAAIALSYGDNFAQCVSHACSLLTLNAIATAMLAHARATGRLNDEDVRTIRDGLGQASADATAVVLVALGQERSALDILNTAQELRQRAIDRLPKRPGFHAI